MPVMDGKGFLKVMRSQSKFENIPVLVLSSIDRSKLKTVFKALGANAVLTKPPRSSELFNTINHCTTDFARMKPATENEENADPNIQSVPDYGNVKVSAAPDILIAEDNVINQTYIKFAMDELGVNYEIVENGQLAYEVWKTRRPKAVFMDISMPLMDGFEATRAIRAAEKRGGLDRTPIIALTGHAMKKDRDECLAKGMDEYMSKPLSLTQLKDYLSNMGVV